MKFCLVIFLAFTAGAKGQTALTEEDFERAKHIDFQALVEQYVAQNITVELLGSSGARTNQHERAVSLQFIMLLNCNLKGFLKAKAIWKGGEIPYEILPGFSANDRAGIANAIAYIQTQTCLRFKPFKEGGAKMTFTPTNQGGFCYTTWTTDGNGKTTANVQLSVNSACTVARTIVHEVTCCQKV